MISRNELEKEYNEKILSHLRTVLTLSMLGLIISPIVWVWFGLLLAFKISVTSFIVLIMSYLLLKRFKDLQKQIVDEVIKEAQQESKENKKGRFAQKMEELQNQNK